MLLDSNRGGEFSAFHDGGEPTSGVEDKLQYTIKGIERRSVELMRDAARVEGMKIGAWVSKRLREAAEVSLRDEDRSCSTGALKSDLVRQDALDAQSSEIAKVAFEILGRVSLIEREVEKLYTMQCSLMSKLEHNR